MDNFNVSTRRLVRIIDMYSTRKDTYGRRRLTKSIRRCCDEFRALAKTSGAIFRRAGVVSRARNRRIRRVIRRACSLIPFYRCIAPAISARFGRSRFISINGNVVFWILQKAPGAHLPTTFKHVRGKKCHRPDVGTDTRVRMYRVIHNQAPRARG